MKAVGSFASVFLDLGTLSKDTLRHLWVSYLAPFFVMSLAELHIFENGSYLEPSGEIFHSRPV